MAMQIAESKNDSKKRGNCIKHEYIFLLMHRSIHRPLSIKELVIGVCPIKLKSLVQMLDFQERSDALLQVQKWLSQVLSSLDYLHGEHLFHLEITTSKVFISPLDSNAFIGDEEFPSGCIKKFGRTKRTDKRSIDLWNYGFLTLEILTKYKDIRAGKIYFRQIPLREELTLDRLKSNMRENFPAVQIKNDDVVCAMNFLQGFFMYEPSNRMTSIAGLSHVFLGQGQYLARDKDPYWESSEEDPQTNIISTRSDIETKKKTRKQRIVNWMQKRYCGMKKLFVRCLGCVKNNQDAALELEERFTCNIIIY